MTFYTYFLKKHFQEGSFLATWKEWDMHNIWEAKHRLSTIVNKTPLIKSHKLSAYTGRNIYLKLETATDIGSFKIRGAANKILSLSQLERSRGVTTFSTGNHGLAVAYVAQKLGIKAVVCISHNVPKNKRQALENMGAEVKIVGDSQEEAGEFCENLKETYGMTIIHPFDDLYVIAGQGTIGLELLEDLPELDHVIVPLSGGGLLSGIGIGLKGASEHIRISGISIEGASAMEKSLQRGVPVDTPEKATLADSLLGSIGRENQYTLSIVSEVMDDMTLLDEEAIAKGMLHLLKEERQIAEGAAAVGVGAILSGRFSHLGQNVVLIITGNNVDPTIYETLSLTELDRIKGACL